MKAILILAVLCLAACNLSDPGANNSQNNQNNSNNSNNGTECADASDCSDNGQCVVEGGSNVCDCDTGYAGADCGTCDDGFVQDASGDCVAMEGGPCDADPDPCDDVSNAVAGSCMPDGDGFTCECEPGFEGDLCSDAVVSCVVDDPCGENGTCDDSTGDIVCECAAGWGGATCEECAPGFLAPECSLCEDGFFGVNCVGTCDTAAMIPWIQTDYGSRRALYVTGDDTVRMGRPISITFDHAALVAAGEALDTGNDFRVFHARLATMDLVELDRVLAVDSGWNQPNTTIVFGLPDALEAPGPGNPASVILVYWGNPNATNPPRDPANVFLPLFGWARENTNNRTLYSPIQLQGGFYSVALRQVSFSRFEVFIRDRSPDVNFVGDVEFTDAAGNVLYRSSYGDYGDFMTPGTFTDSVDIPNLDFTVEISTVEMNASAQFFGAEQINGAGGRLLRSTRNFSRAQYDEALASTIATTGCPTEIQ